MIVAPFVTIAYLAQRLHNYLEEGALAVGSSAPEDESDLFADARRGRVADGRWR